MIAQGALEVFGSKGGSLGSPNIAALGYLPPSLIYFTSGPNVGQLRAKQRFTYTAKFLPLTAGATQSAQTNIQADSDFVWIASNITVVDAATNRTFTNPAPILCRIIDTGSGTQLMDDFVPVANVFGTQGSPFINFGVPYIFRRGSTVQIDLTSQNNADFNVRIGYLGFKVFDFPAQ